MPRTLQKAARMAEHNGYDSRSWRRNTGNIFYADSGASSGGNGLSPEGASLLADTAHNLCTASNGDIVYLMEGHAENITASATLTADTAGVSFIGLGNGRNRPILTWTATASQAVVSAANVRFENIVFNFAGIDAVVAAFSITGTDCTFENCEFVVNTATAGCVLGLLTAATATRFRVLGCRFLGTYSNSGTTVTACIKHEVGIDYEFSRNFFCGKMTQAILNATTITNGLIDANLFNIGTGTAAITMETSSAGLISRNVANVASGTAPYAGAAMSYSQNHYTTEGNGPTAGTADAI